MQRGLPAAAGVFLSSIGVLWLGLERSALSILDEGVITYGALRLLGGELPYRDFWTVYGPGQFWAVAALFKMFGASLLVERAWDLFLRACIALVAYLIAARLASPRLAVAAWLVALGWLWVVGHHGYPLVPAALLAMLAALLFIDFALEPGSAPRLMACGAAVGAAALFRHDVGFYAFASMVAALAMLRWRGAPIRLARCLAQFTAGVLAAGLPAALYLLLQVPFADLWSQLIVFPSSVYPAMRSLPYPSVFDWLFRTLDLALGGWSLAAASQAFSMLAFFFPCAVLAAAAAALAKAWPESAGEPGRGRWVSLFALTVLAAALFMTSLVRPDAPHLLHVFVLSVVIAAPLLHARQERWHRAAALAVAAGLAGMAVHPLLEALARARGERAPRGTVEAEGLPRAGGFLLARDQAQAIAYVRERVPPTEKIFVGNGRHDMAFLSDVLFYFLAERGAASKFHELHPGLTTSAPVQQRIIEDLSTGNVNYAVFYLGAHAVREPNLSAQSSGVALLDSYLLQNYRQEAIFGRYFIGRRK